MPRQFSTDFGERLRIAKVRVVALVYEYTTAILFLQRELQAFNDKKRQIEDQCIQTDKILECHEANEKIQMNEELETHTAYLSELQSFEKLEQIIVELRSKVNELEQFVAEQGSMIKKNAESIPILNEMADRNERRLSTLLKWCETLKKIYLIMRMIELWNMETDEAVSVQKIETENASEGTDGGSTTVERKTSSEVDDGGSSAETMEKVEEFSTYEKLTRSEKQGSEMPPGESSEEQLEVKQSSSKIDQSSITDSIEARQELSDVAGRLTIEAIGGFQISTRIYADRTEEIMEGLARLEDNLERLKRIRKCVGLPEEFSADTDEKCKERLDELTLQFQELDELLGTVDTVRKEFSEL